MTLTAAQLRTLRWISEHGFFIVKGDKLVNMHPPHPQPRKNSTVPLLHLLQLGLVVRITWSGRPCFSISGAGFDLLRDLPT